MLDGDEPDPRARPPGRPLEFAALDPASHATLAALRSAVDAQAKDWTKVTR